MKISDLVSMASMAYGLYVRLGEVARAQGMSPEDFNRAVEAETGRISSWVQSTNAAEDAVFDATSHKDG